MGLSFGFEGCHARNVIAYSQAVGMNSPIRRQRANAV
jgi:hypothetical protein